MAKTVKMANGGWPTCEHVGVAGTAMHGSARRGTSRQG
jgi:hypothetical protein